MDEEDTKTKSITVVVSGSVDLVSETSPKGFKSLGVYGCVWVTYTSWVDLRRCSGATLNLGSPDEHDRRHDKSLRWG